MIRLTWPMVFGIVSTMLLGVADSYTPNADNATPSYRTTEATALYSKALRLKSVILLS